MPLILSLSAAVLLAAAPPATAPKARPMTTLERGCVGGGVGGLIGAGLLGGATLATGLIISANDCSGGCIDSEGTGYIALSPVAAVAGLVLGTLVGAVVGVVVAPGPVTTDDDQAMQPPD